MQGQEFRPDPLFAQEKPSAIGYFFALILFVVGNYYFVDELLTSADNISFGSTLVVEAPGETVVTAKERASFTIWNEVRSPYYGKNYSASVELPDDIQISGMHSETKEPIEFKKGGSAVVRVGSNSERHSVGSFQVEEAGNYLVKIEGSFPRRVFTIRQSFFSTIFNALRLNIAWLAIAWFVAPIIWIFAWSARSRFQEPQGVSGMGVSGMGTLTTPGSVFNKSASSRAFDDSPHNEKFESASDKKEHGSRAPRPEPVKHKPMPGVAGSRFKKRAAKRDDHSFSMMCHLSAFSGLLFPMGNIIGPVVMMSLSRGRGDFVQGHAKSSVNFQISMMLALVICFFLCAIFIGFILLPMLLVFWLLSVVKASSMARSGLPAQYKLCINFIS